MLLSVIVFQKKTYLCAVIIDRTALMSNRPLSYLNLNLVGFRMGG